MCCISSISFYIIWTRSDFDKHVRLLLSKFRCLTENQLSIYKPCTVGVPVHFALWHVCFKARAYTNLLFNIDSLDIYIYIYIYPMIKLYRYNMCIELSSHSTESNWFFRFNDLFVSAPRAFYSLTKVHDPCPVPCILQLMPGKNRRTASIPTPASPMQQPRHDGMCQQSESDQCSFVCQCMLHRPVPFPSQGCAKGAAYASCVLAVGMNTCRIYHALNTGILDSN